MWQQGEHFACAKTNGTKRPQCHVRETTSDGIPKSRRFLERWRRGLLRRERASWEASASRSGGGNNRWREIVRTGMAGEGREREWRLRRELWRERSLRASRWRGGSEAVGGRCEEEGGSVWRRWRGEGGKKSTLGEREGRLTVEATSGGSGEWFGGGGERGIA